MTWTGFYLNFLLILSKWISLREKCLCPELFWSVFSHIRAEYGKMRIRITPNTDTFNAMYFYLKEILTLNGLTKTYLTTIQLWKYNAG